MNPAQQKVLGITSGSLLITAGPGTGKTRTLISWITSLLSGGYAKPSEILAITFTNRASDEMKERLYSLCGKAGENINIHTFHSFCFELVKERFPAISSVFDDKKRNQYLGLLFPELNKKEIHELASHLKKYFENPDKPIPENYRTHAQTYLDAVKKSHGVDLSALVPGVNQLFRREPDFLQKVREQYTYIAIDELQDINLPQYTLINHLFPVSEQADGNRGICAIGDPDQAIYGFRGSDLSLFRDFKNTYTPVEIELDMNYRSTEQIVKAGEGIISYNSVRKMVSLTSVKGHGGKIGVYYGENPASEGKFIAAKIEQLVGGMSFTASDLSYESGAHLYSFSDIAILARTRALFNDVIPFLTGAGIPLSIHHARSLMDEPPFSHVFSILTLLAHKHDIVSLYTILTTFYDSFSENDLSRIIPLLNDNPGHEPDIRVLLQNNRITDKQYEDYSDFFSFYHMLSETLEQEGVKGVLLHIFDKYVDTGKTYDLVSLKKEALCESAEKYGTDLIGFLRKSVLSPHESECVMNTDKVHLLTFHAAKGCEFPVVFIAGTSEGITPVLSKNTDIEEERRLFYVAVTRAKDRVIISSASERRIFGKIMQTEPSRFIREIPGHLLCTETYADKKRDNDKYGQPLLF